MYITTDVYWVFHKLYIASYVGKYFVNNTELIKQGQSWKIA